MNDPILTPTVTELKKQHTVVVRAENVRPDGIAAVFDSSFGPVAGVIEKLRLENTGAAFGRYETEDGSSFTIEVGFAVQKPLLSPVEVEDTLVQGSFLPAGKVATVSHIGGYDGMGGAWQGLMQWVGQEGLIKPGAVFWEIYVTEPTPETDPSTLRTDLFVQIADPAS